MRRLAFCFALSFAVACGPSAASKVSHGNVSAGGCQVCPVDGGFHDDCAIVGQYTYFCIGETDGGVCAVGVCAQQCSSSLDCSYRADCQSKSTLWGTANVCVTVR